MISTATFGSHDGRCPLPAACWRKCTCMIAAPCSNAAFASDAICSGVTGTGNFVGSVSTPVSAHEMMTLSDTAEPLQKLLKTTQVLPPPLMGEDSARLG